MIPLYALIADGLDAALRKRAHTEGRSIKAVVHDALCLYLTTEPEYLAAKGLLDIPTITGEAPTRPTRSPKPATGTAKPTTLRLTLINSDDSKEPIEVERARVVSVERVNSFVSRLHLVEPGETLTILENAGALKRAIA